MTPRTAFNVFCETRLQQIKALPIHQARVLIAPPIKRPAWGAAAAREQRHARMAKLERHWQLRLEQYWA